jgi:transposase-like protein
MPKTRKSYTSDKKLEVVENAKSNGNRSVTRLYEVNEKQIRNWRKEKPILQAMIPTKRARRSRKLFWPELELNLKKCFTEERAKARCVSTVMIRMKAKELEDQKSTSDFMGSPKWCFKFMKMNRLSIRAVTSVGQNLPSDWEEKKAAFKLFVDNIKTGIDLQHVGNMDEVLVCFDMAGNYTVEKKGIQDIRITTEHEKCFFYSGFMYYRQWR